MNILTSVPTSPDDFSSGREETTGALSHSDRQIVRSRESIRRSRELVEESKRWLISYRSRRDVDKNNVGGRRARQELYEALGSISPLLGRCRLGHHQDFSFGQYEPCPYCIPSAARCERCAAVAGNNGLVAFWRDLERFGFPATQDRRLPLGMKDFCFMLCDDCLSTVKRRRKSDFWLRSRLRPN